MGGEDLHAAPAQPQGNVASYKVIKFAGKDLPENYKGVIYSKWLRSLRFGNDFFRLMDSAAYYSNYHKLLGSILLRPDTCVSLAVLSDDSDVVLGFSVYRGATLEYVQVHMDLRRLGIGTKLVPKDIERFTHVTKTGITIWKKKYRDLVFNPFA